MNVMVPNKNVVATTADVIPVLQNSLYPGAKRESIELVLAWCRATGRDPMKKPVHIVPTSVKDAVTGQYSYRDVLMLGIGTYRTDAAQTGEYVGKDEPEFGPEVTRKIGGVEVTFPQWCKVTIYRWVHGAARAFSAKEFWLENYASKKDGSPNDMWRRRSYGQLAKCAESQALRMAFPDQTGNTYTAEEMEGKGDDVIDAVAVERVQTTAEYLGDSLPPDEPPPSPDPAREVRKRLDTCHTLDDVAKVDRAWQKACEKKEPPPVLAQAVRDMIAERAAQLQPQDRDDTDQGDDMAGSLTDE